MKQIPLSGFIALFVGFIGAATAWAVSISNHATAAAPDANVVSVGNAVTEIVYALDQGHRLVARDSTSNYPPEARDLPNVGYFMALSAEGVLSMQPQMILATEGAGPAEVIEVLKSTGIDFIEVPGGFTAEAIADKIRVIGAALGVPDKAEALATRTTADLMDARHDTQPNPKRVLFLMSAKGGKLIAAGGQTAAQAVIELAGAVNAVQGFDGYKTLEDEAAIAAAPDLIMMMDRPGPHGANADELFALPTLAATPAGQTRALVTMDGARLLGFGPRTGEVVRDLHAIFYGG